MSQIKQIKDAVNIADIIGERIKLSRSGSSLKANCPFHGEKTPSFFVNEQMQRYRCFGCGENGDVIEFLEKFEGMTFLESLRYLADKTGIEIKEFKKTAVDDERDRLLEILNLAKEYYSYLLTKHKIGIKARDYLKERGTSSQSIKLFQMGYSLPSWDGLLNYLHKKKKYSLEDLLKAGLVVKNRSGRYYDRFRGRIMFPLKNHRGQVVGFSGRLLDKNAKEAKYINSPETLLYHKSKVLYGYSELFREIKKKEEVIVVEGEFDVISSTQVHVNNIVAIKGSALTPDQVKLLERVSQRVLLSLDRDDAGVKATRRAIEVAKDSDLELRVLDFSILDNDQDAKDPDDLAMQDPSLWRSIASKSISVYQFLLDISIKKHDSSVPEGKKHIIQEMASVIDGIPLNVEKDFYLKKLSEELNVKVDLIKNDIAQTINKQNRFVGRKTKDSDGIKKPKIKSLRDRLESYLLFLLLRSRSEEIKTKAKQIKKLKLTTIGATQIIQKLIDFKPIFDLKKFASFLAEDLKKLVFDWYMYPEFVQMLETVDKDKDKEWDKTIKSLKKQLVKDQVGLINIEIEKLDKKQNKSETEEVRFSQLLKKIVELQRTIN